MSEYRSEYRLIEDLIDSPYIIRMVILVDEKGKARLGDFSTISKSTRTINDIVLGLESHGVFRVEIVARPRRTVNISLTKKGKRIATFFKQAIEVLNEPRDGNS